MVEAEEFKRLIDEHLEIMRGLYPGYLISNWGCELMQFRRFLDKGEAGIYKQEAVLLPLGLAPKEFTGHSKYHWIKKIHNDVGLWIREERVG